MTYINVKTQAVITTACVVRGGDWVEADGKKSKRIPKPRPIKKAQKMVMDDD